MIEKPLDKKFSLFSIYYDNDGFNIKGDRLMGRQAAGWSFLKSIVKSNNYNRLGVYLRMVINKTLKRY